MARPRKHDGVVYRRRGTQFWWMRYWDRAGIRREEPTGTADWKEAQKKLRERLQARDDNVLEIVRKGEELSFKPWAELFLENYSKPPLRSPKTHEANARAVKHLVKAFGDQKLADLTSDAIEGYLRYRLRQRARWKTKAGIVEKGLLKPSTVHQELRVLRRIHQVDLENKVVWIPDSKTPNGVAEVPLTDLAVGALRDQTQLAGNSPYLFPSDNAVGHQTTFKTAWRLTLRRAKVPYFRIYDLRSTYATRLSAGGVADEWSRSCSGRAMRRSSRSTRR